LVTISTSCSNDNETETEETIDNIVPTIACASNINETIDATTNELAVNFTTPIGMDNLPGAITTQTEGLASGQMFPVGTTTNTFVVEDAAGNTASCSFNITISTPIQKDGLVEHQESLRKIPLPKPKIISF